MDSNEFPSIRSEDGYSTSTSLSSGLTGYEDELNEIKHILNLGSVHKVKKNGTDKNTIDVSTYETRINNLTSELQTSLKLNEKYKNQLFSLERSNELRVHEHFEKLLQANSSLENQLASANKQFSLLMKNKSNSLPNSLSLEKLVSELQIELEQNRNENHANTAIHQDLNLQLNELSLELKIKQNCIDELKKKVTEQHIDIGKLKQSNALLTSNCTCVKLEFEHLRKSNVWYKEQLHSCQTEKKKVVEDFLTVKKDLINGNRENERLQLQMENLKKKYMELMNDYKNLEDNLLKQIQKLETKNTLMQQPLEPVKKRVNNVHENEIKSLQESILVIQSNLEEQRTLFNAISKENVNLQSHLTIVENELDNKQLSIELTECNYKEISTKYLEIKEELKQRNNQLLSSNSLNSKLQLALESVTEERDEITRSIVAVRKDFQRFLNLHQETKQELLQRKMEAENSEYDLKVSQKMLKEFETSEKENFMIIRSVNDELKHLKDDKLVLMEVNANKCHQYERALDEMRNNIVTLENVLKGVLDNFTEYFARRPVKSIQESGIEYVTNLNAFFEKLQKFGGTEAHAIFKRKLLDRLHKIEDRVSVVDTKCEESFKLLETKTTSKPCITTGADDLLKLRAALQVKDLKSLEKQKKYEIVNRTLLKKIKEHMKARSKAEKQCSYLETMYNDTMEKLNTSRLELSTKAAELADFKNMFREKNRALEKLQNAVTNLEMKLEQNKISSEQLNAISEEIKTKHACIVALNLELTALRDKSDRLREHYDKVLIKCDNLQDDKIQLENSRQEHLLDCTKTIGGLEMELTELQDKIEYYLKENEILKCNMINKNCEIADLQERNGRIQSAANEKEQFVKRLQNEANQSMETCKRSSAEKMCLQGLINDFKTALNSAIKENQDLKQRILLLTKEKMSSSLPTELIINPLDYKHINSLINRAQMSEVNSLGKLEDSLNCLKREMACLQKQIVEKNFSVSSL
ncbi:PREDICTED: major antigen-like [Nicrophorus vespilloides]|uniref:Major antigen-like n=1 Tax=Nicrophorus vespilloides TaxID=110193 RepID=A0ABM1NDM8_NICVS|nr:PREDICTED: major antigen-like [Nicrophorus vespilloides]XP_017784928.1 PREDICTED: major antigen-like [Nicrophorus vespilloides]